MNTQAPNRHPLFEETARVVSKHPLLLEAVKKHNKMCPTGGCPWTDLELRVLELRRQNAMPNVTAQGRTETAGEEQQEKAAPARYNVNARFADNGVLGITNVKEFIVNYDADFARVHTHDGESHIIVLENTNVISFTKGGVSERR